MGLTHTVPKVKHRPNIILEKGLKLSEHEFSIFNTFENSYSGDNLQQIRFHYGKRPGIVNEQNTPHKTFVTFPNS